MTQLIQTLTGIVGTHNVLQGTDLSEYELDWRCLLYTSRCV